jgi:Domain of unknown function (DUF4440)
MKYFILLLAALSMSCRAEEKAPARQPDSAETGEAGRTYSQVSLTEDSPYPNVGISTYTLITDNVEARRGDAEVIMRRKIEWPRAMQTKDEALFNRILARGFTFRGEQEFYNREDYIRDRVGNDEAVASAHYENLALQFFGEVAVLTYRNTVKIKDASGKPETLHMTWADILVREDGEWKIGASHLIDSRVGKE